MTKGIIALDADGVLLDYGLAYASAWQKAFGTYPGERDPLAYWPIDRWEVERVEGDRLDLLRRAFDNEFWSSIPPVPGAIEACHKLAAAGYELVCVTALPAEFRAAREHNLRLHGFEARRCLVQPGQFTCCQMTSSFGFEQATGRNSNATGAASRVQRRSEGAQPKTTCRARTCISSSAADAWSSRCMGDEKRVTIQLIANSRFVTLLGGFVGGSETVSQAVHAIDVGPSASTARFRPVDLASYSTASAR